MYVLFNFIGKLCDKPLLDSDKIAPKPLFSGSNGSQIFKSTLYSKLISWCAKSGSYLLLDLQKEYHIMKVLTVGDKQRNKWSESYSLKYSYNKTLVDNIMAIEVIHINYKKFWRNQSVIKPSSVGPKKTLYSSIKIK